MRNISRGDNITLVVLRVTAVEPVSSHELRLTFNDGVVREVDIGPMMWGELGEPLRDPDYFRRVRIDEESRTIAWPNGFEPDPDVLHGDHQPARPGPTGAPDRTPRTRRRGSHLPLVALVAAGAVVVFGRQALRELGRLGSIVPR